MKSICGLNCDTCPAAGSYNGCIQSKGRPFGKQCFIAQYIKTGDEDAFNKFKAQLISEFNSLKIEGMPKAEKLYALSGTYVNLSYPTPGGKEIRLLDDSEIFQKEIIKYENNKSYRRY